MNKMRDCDGHLWWEVEAGWWVFADTEVQARAETRPWWSTANVLQSEWTPFTRASSLWWR